MVSSEDIEDALTIAFVSTKASWITVSRRPLGL